jgi:hypothetical protein
MQWAAATGAASSPHGCTPGAPATGSRRPGSSCHRRTPRWPHSTSGMPTAAHDRERIRHAPAVFVLDTHADRPRAWLIAGMALGHMLLHAASRGLQAAFLNQPV